MTELTLHGVSTIPQCTAHSRSGNRCKRRPIPGGMTCHVHGGGTPIARTRAAERLLAAVDPAVTELLRIMRSGDTDTVKLRAVEAILDRTGYPRSMTVGGGMSEGEAKAALVAALIASRDAQKSDGSA